MVHTVFFGPSINPCFFAFAAIARILTLFFLRLAEGKVKVKSLSRVQTLCDPVDCSLPGSMRFSRQEYWSGLPFPSPGDLPDPGIEPRSPTVQADALTSEPPEGKEGTKS